MLAGIDQSRRNGMESSYKAYAGIGSQVAPAEVLSIMESAATVLADLNVTLRSGGAQGSDKAFERGCDAVKGRKEIFLPWKGFEGSKSLLYAIPTKAFVLASKFHPGWAAMEAGGKQGALKMHARNVLQILGAHLDSPVRGVICWTKGGRGEGGTGQALRVASSRHIPVLDLGRYSDVGEMEDVTMSFIEDFV